MKTWKAPMSRRNFLRGSAGVVMALPFLEGLVRTSPALANTQRPVYFVCLRSGNGVAQFCDPTMGAPVFEPERFWPFERGALTQEMMLRTNAQNEIRTTGELVAHRDKLLIVDGIRYSYEGRGCGHSGGGNQCLTASPPFPDDDGHASRSRPADPSVDWVIEQKMKPRINANGVNVAEPLTMAAGVIGGFIDDIISYAPPLPGQFKARVRVSERNPWQIYKSLFGNPSDVHDDLMFNKIVKQRQSVNDLLRDQLGDLRRNSGLSQADHVRLDLYQNSIFELEERMLACHLPEAEWKAIEAAGDSNAWQNASNAEPILHMMMDITALAFACDLKRAATIQIGSGADFMTYNTTGPAYQFHWVSHRIQSDGGDGDPIANADHVHYQIDRIHARWFKYLIERLDEYDTDQGTLLDNSIALWTNDVATGRMHAFHNLPVVIAGSGGGYLKQGVYVDARATATISPASLEFPPRGFVANNQLFNTILNAVGVRNDDGSPIDDFGHKGSDTRNQQPGGEIPGMKA
ncbi:MAG: DUF1552 domain-containing protein [Bradymonadaceae bacterium]|nr:DUF1552 domain-containing protein [Lujinxingiaceae bacterium]